MSKANSIEESRIVTNRIPALPLMSYLKDEARNIYLILLQSIPVHLTQQHAASINVAFVTLLL